MKYTTLADVKNYILKTVDANYDAVINSYIDGVSTYIDKYCNRIIYRNTPEVIKYDGDNTSLTRINDCVAITAVVVDDVDVTTRIFKYPTNKPYTSRIVLEDEVFPKGLQNVEVNAIHSMSASLPDDIKLACTIMVGAICRSQILGEKAGTSERIGNYQVSYTTPEQKGELEMAKNILNGYKRITL